MSVSKRWDTSPRQRVVIAKASAGTMFEGSNGNIETITRHSRRLTWAHLEVVACYANCAEVLPLKLGP